MPHASTTKSNFTNCTITSRKNSNNQLRTSNNTTAVDIGNINASKDTLGNISLVMISYARACLDLSLIHISEPTRPY